MVYIESNFMRNNKSGFLITCFIFSILLFAVSCESTPENKQHDTVKQDHTAPSVTDSKPQTETADEAHFDPSRITQEQYNSTRNEVRQFIERINLIIRNSNFMEWESLLSLEYIAEIASEENLNRISDTAAMKNRRIVLRNLEDYFIHLVVPSRVDVNYLNIEIEFLTETRVIAFDERWDLYELEKVGNSWTIIK